MRRTKIRNGVDVVFLRWSAPAIGRVVNRGCGTFGRGMVKVRCDDHDYDVSPSAILAPVTHVAANALRWRDGRWNAPHYYGSRSTGSRIETLMHPRLVALRDAESDRDSALDCAVDCERRILEMPDAEWAEVRARMVMYRIADKYPTRRAFADGHPDVRRWVAEAEKAQARLDSMQAAERGEEG